MIPQSKADKLARKSDGLIIAEGNKKEMHDLRKKNPNTEIWFSLMYKVGDKIK